MPHLKIVNRRLNIILCSLGDTNNRSRSAVLPDNKLHECEASGSHSCANEDSSLAGYVIKLTELPVDTSL